MNKTYHSHDCDGTQWYDFANLVGSSCFEYGSCLWLFQLVHKIFPFVNNLIQR